MITFITVNYNNAGATEALLRSLEEQSDQNFDVIVVDNGSEATDRSLLGEYASTSSLKLDLILSDTNRGFSGGNNMAIRKALEQGSEWVVLINNDTTVSDDFIALLQPQLERSAAVIGLPLREGERVAYAGIVQWLKPTLAHSYTLEERDALLERNYPLYAIGAGVAIHRDAAEKIGLLDERYFLYFEDADYAMRARKKGVAVRFLDGPLIDHGVSGSTSRLGAPLLLRYHARNALLFNHTHGPFWVRVILPFAAFYGMFLQLTKIVLMPSRRTVSRAIRDGIIDYYAKRFGRLPAPGQEDRH